MSQSCAIHSNAPALYKCDGCGRKLCATCIKPSHRLLMCKICGELALPVGGGMPSTSTALRKSSARGASYNFLQALLYSFRGQGGGLFWVYVILLLVFQWLPRILPFGALMLSLIIFIASVAIGLLIPRLIFMIVRRTAEGDNELPDWPEFEFLSRLGDLVVFIGCNIVPLLPGVALFFLLDCSVFELFSVAADPDYTGPNCWPLVILSAVFAMFLWIPTLGSVSTYDSPWLAPRIDLHVRALLVDPIDAIVILMILAAILVAGTALIAVLTFASLWLWVVEIAAIIFQVYFTFTYAHLIGLYFRRNYDRLERLYVG